jgi:hypothetical protein
MVIEVTPTLIPREQNQSSSQQQIDYRNMYGCYANIMKSRKPRQQGSINFTFFNKTYKIAGG